MSKVDGLLAWFIPRRCVLCHAPSGATCVCAGCCADLPWVGPSCPACGLSLPPGAAPGVCGRCGADSRHRARVQAALSYEYPVDRLVTGAKFRGQLHFARALGELLTMALERTGTAADPPDLLVPVPLHRRRLAERGYNQALEIARPVAESLCLPLSPGLCERLRNTPEQTGLSAAERRRNLRQVFTVRGACAGARVAVVDDVITTGSTAAAMAQALREAGAAQVEVWAVARTLLKQEIRK